MTGNTIQFPLRLGLAEDANKKAPPMSSLKRGHNIRWVRDGVIGKSFAFAQRTELPGGAGAPLRFITRGPELSVTDGQKLYTYSPTTESWVESDRVVEVGLEAAPLIDDENGVSESDVAVYGNLLFHAYIGGDPSLQDGSGPTASGSTSLYVQAIDWTSGRVVLKPMIVSQFTLFLRVLLVGEYAVVIYNASTTIRAVPVRLNEAAGVSVGTDAAILANVRYDNDAYGLNSRLDAVLLASGQVAVAYERTSTTALAVQLFTVASGMLSASGSPAAYATETNIRSLALAEDVGAGRLYVLLGRLDTEPTQFVRLLAMNNASLAASLAPMTLDDDFRAHHVTLAVPSTGSVLAVWSGVRQSFPDWPETCSQLVTSGALVAKTRRVSAGIILLSSLFSLGGRSYVFARDAHYGENHYYDEGANLGLGGEVVVGDPAAVPSISSYLLEVERDVFGGDISLARVPHRVVGKIDHDVAAGFRQGSLPNAARLDASTALACIPFQATASAHSFNFRAGLRLVTATVDHARMPDPWRCLTIGSESYIGGAGMLCAWDGRTVFDHGMRTPFVFVSQQESNLGGMASGTYLYQFGAGYRSHAGVLHRGPLSNVATVILEDDPGAGSEDGLSSARIGALPSSIDGKETVRTGFAYDAAVKSFFNLFRSEAGGSILYERTFGPRLQTIINKPHNDPTAFIDAAGDENISVPTQTLGVPAVPLASRPQPYSATGELEDVQPPASRTACLHLNRAFQVALDGTVWFSKDTSENPGIAPGFNPSLVRLFDRKPTAIFSFVDRLIAMFERGAKFIVGDGPTVAGTDDRFSTPQTIQGEIGTTNPRSIVVTPVGAFFQSTNGDIYLLDGGLAMTWIGKDVRDTLAKYPQVTSAVHVADQREVRFTCNGTPNDTFSGILIVFDYQRGTWMTRSTPDDAPVADAILCDGAYYLATSIGIFRETPGAFLDINGDFRASTAVFNPIAPAGPISWHRVRRAQLLGRSLSPHDLTVSLARDFADATEQSKLWPSSSDVTQLGPLERAQIAPAHQKLQAIEVHVNDASPTSDEEAAEEGGPIYVDPGSGEGFQLEGVALLVQTKQGLARITKSRRG